MILSGILLVVKEYQLFWSSFFLFFISSCMPHDSWTLVVLVCAPPWSPAPSNSNPKLTTTHYSLLTTNRSNSSTAAIIIKAQGPAAAFSMDRQQIEWEQHPCSQPWFSVEWDFPTQTQHHSHSSFSSVELGCFLYHHDPQPSYTLSGIGWWVVMITHTTHHTSSVVEFLGCGWFLSIIPIWQC